MRTAPASRRIKAPFAGPATQATCFGAVVNAGSMFSNTLTGGADPETPIFKAAPGQQFRIGLTHPNSSNRGTTFTLHGHVWPRDPYLAPQRNAAGLPDQRQYRQRRFGGDRQQPDADVLRGAGEHHRFRPLRHQADNRRGWRGRGSGRLPVPRHRCRRLGRWCLGYAAGAVIRLAGGRPPASRYGGAVQVGCTLFFSSDEGTFGLFRGPPFGGRRNRLRGQGSAGMAHPTRDNVTSAGTARPTPVVNVRGSAGTARPTPVANVRRGRRAWPALRRWCNPGRGGGHGPPYGWREVGVCQAGPPGTAVGNRVGAAYGCRVICVMAAELGLGNIAAT